MRCISFNPAMLSAVRAGRKTVTRRRLSPDLLVQQDPSRYRYADMSELGARFEDSRTKALLPPVLYPWGEPGEVLQVQEAPTLRLLITGIRAEQVRSLSEADARAEGIRCREQDGSWQWGGVEPAEAGSFRWYASLQAAFQGLLNSIYPTAWARNEWVWVVEFIPCSAAGNPFALTKN